MTIADLKRDVASKHLVAEMTYRYGENIPDRLKGVRPILRCNTVAVIFRNNNGAESEMRIPRASLVDYDGAFLRIYTGGYRDLTAEEARLMDEWKAKEATYPPYQETYWIRKDFFTKHDMKHLLGHEVVKGMKLSWIDGVAKIYDERIKGNKILEYKIMEA